MPIYKRYVKFLFTSIKLPDGKGMIWKLFPDGDEVNDRLYFDHLPAIEDFYGKSDSINGFDLQKAVIKAFSLLREVFKVWNAFKVRVIFKPFKERNQLQKAPGLSN